MSSLKERIEAKSKGIIDTREKDALKEALRNQEEAKKRVEEKRQEKASLDKKLKMCSELIRRLNIADISKEINTSLLHNKGHLIDYAYHKELDIKLSGYGFKPDLGQYGADASGQFEPEYRYYPGYVYATNGVIWMEDLKRVYQPDNLFGFFSTFKYYEGRRNIFAV